MRWMQQSRHSSEIASRKRIAMLQGRWWSGRCMTTTSVDTESGPRTALDNKVAEEKFKEINKLFTSDNHRVRKQGFKDLDF